MLACRKAALTPGIVVLSGVCMSGVPAAGGSAVDPSETARAVVEAARDSPARANPTAPNGNPLWAVPLNDLSATRERPIFSPSRRLPEPAVFVVAAAEPPKPVPTPQEPARPSLELMGTIVGESRQIGVFLEKTTKEMIRLTTGEIHGGWVLRSVDTRGVQFEKGQLAATLALRPPDHDKLNQGKMTGSSVAAAELIPPARHRKR
jgi:general secretion pathway protein N